MNSDVKAVVPDLGIKADSMTHGLKVRGNGSMLEGIRNMCMDAYREGEKVGLKKGIVYGVIGTLTLALLCKGNKILCLKNEPVNIERLNSNSIQKEETEEQPKHGTKGNKEFHWTKVKWSMYMKNYFDILSFENWIHPLECKVYKDRIFLEFPSESEKDILHLKNNYKHLIEKYIFDTIGKRYIVTFVRPGEIIIEDDI